MRLKPKNTMIFIYMQALCLAFCVLVEAQNRPVKKRTPAAEQAESTPQAQVIGDPAFIYKEANFDSEIIGTAVTGEVYNVSKGVKGSFRKLRLKPGVVGFVSTDDVKMLSGAAAKKIKSNEAQAEKKKSPKVRSVEWTKYRGPALQITNFAEDTLGALRTTPLYFFGAKVSGYDTLLEGDIYTETNLLLEWGAPKYYGDVTRKSAEGWIIMADFLWQMVFPQSKYHMLFMGAGPLLRYAHFNATIRDTTGKDISYSMDDLTLGAAVNGGLAYQFGRYDVRLDVKYIWERQKYFAYGVGFQWPF